MRMGRCLPCSESSEGLASCSVHPAHILYSIDISMQASFVTISLTLCSKHRHIRAVHFGFLRLSESGPEVEYRLAPLYLL
jgi:hypothetical protein